jgi:hypothetical protein
MFLMVPMGLYTLAASRSLQVLESSHWGLVGVCSLSLLRTRNVAVIAILVTLVALVGEVTTVVCSSVRIGVGQPQQFAYGQLDGMTVAIRLWSSKRNEFKCYGRSPALLLAIY